jgi:hypothetical protein
MTYSSRKISALQGIIYKYFSDRPERSMKPGGRVAKNTNGWRILLRYFWLCGACITVMFPAISSAVPATSVGNPEIVRQLKIVNRTLAALSTQIDESENRLQERLDILEGDLIFLVEDAQSVEKDIKISSSVCFAHGFYNKLDVGFGAEFGAEWPLLVSANAKGKVDLRLAGTKLDLGSKICINVPLYKLASDPLADFSNTADFDQLIADLVAPSQAIVPLVATLYTVIMPSKEEVMLTTANIVEAALGYDILTGAVGTPNPAMLLRPDVLFEPIISGGPYQAFVDYIPTALANMATDPCQALADSPLQINVNNIPVCAIGGTAAHIAFNLIDPLHLLHPYQGGIIP